MHYMVDENDIKANNAKWQRDPLHVEMMNGRELVVPAWLLPELQGLSNDELHEIEIIDGGRGILFGDQEGVSMQRLLGAIQDKETERGTGTFGLL